ncbi:uncharacterized protein LOC123556356 [Mercenaria mercenaria]|uniref:uncharacterized protein LOC123556356 n=1 Tax=Mercenaria mercenaria TaxID=6596 RepID=UPI00234F252A|nr:uncharacterized protein LOC123556356 [Mercenaria mercenaria]
MTKQPSDSVGGRISSLNTDLDCSSDFSVSVYGGNSIQSGSGGRISSLNTDLDSSSDFSVSVYSGNSIKSGSDELQNTILCDVCDKGEKQCKAEGFCVDCQEYLCKECCDYHKKLKVLQSHVLQDINTISKTTYKAKGKRICEEKCSSHSDRVIEFFCQSCDQLGCTICITTQHNKCSSLHHIPDIVAELKETDEYKGLLDALKETAMKLEQNKAKYETNVEKKTYYRERAKYAIKKHRDEMNQLFDSFEKQVESELDSMDIYNADLLKSILGRQESVTLDFQAINTSLEHNTQNMCKLFIAMKKAKQELETVQDKILTLDVNNHVVNYKFEADGNYHELMERIKHSGKIQLVHSSLKKEEAQREEVNIKSDDDKVSGTISGLCLLTEDKLVLTDVRNEAVKVIEVKGELVLSTLTMSSKPWDVARIEEDKIAVTLPEDKKIKFLSVNQAISEEKEIDVCGSCRGIAYGSGQLIVSFDKPESKVQILDETGQVTKIFEKDTFGNQLFSKPWYLGLSPDGFTIYVSDNSENTVTSLNLEGKVKGIYKDKDLKKPVGVTVDAAGTVYVVGSSMYSSNIHQLSENLMNVNVLGDLGHGIICPRSAVFNNREQKLYVGMEFSDKILVLSMKSA